MTDALGLTALPRGRHRLSREQVEKSQRLRLAFGMADACGAYGYSKTSVKAVLERAGVSRLTFYELYVDKLDCFLDALDLVAAVLADELDRVLADDADADAAAGKPVNRAIRALDSYLRTLEHNLSLARLYVVEAHAAGPEALIRRNQLQTRVSGALVTVVEADTPQDRFACEMYVAGVSALITLPVATGDLDALRALRDPLVDQLLRLAAH